MSENRKQTQAETILKVLQDYAGCWVPCYILRSLSMSHTRRISDLKERGHIIELRDEYVDGQRRTAYRLVKSS
jgi:protein involved in temperature-dependent protein secretion